MIHQIWVLDTGYRNDLAGFGYWILDTSILGTGILGTGTVPVLWVRVPVFKGKLGFLVHFRAKREEKTTYFKAKLRCFSTA